MQVGEKLGANMVGSLIRFKQTGEILIAIKKIKNKNNVRHKDGYYRFLGIHNHRWYEISFDNPYIEVISANMPKSGEKFE